ncbi:MULTISPECIES: DUF4240 domain-containing protein [Chryseobacterium]|nr:MULTISPECIES: DUF4240 domain-containing protein [Chryseobacterium]ASE61644.2 DUF4240 domain-containing protein [Chryseobacterium indologenes]AZB32296.1 DUF4240 domain-containing protein [Chryseobacterium bernardetii]QQY29878.1 DUF4240 domain-containing protein [Chryseobacterium gleum]UMQ41663.1 DUF4240 domain-containing protein [Chryseobacterium sp. Y16C]
MKFLKNLFGKNEKSEPVITPNAYSLRLEKTAEMLDENLFWKIVDSSVKNSSNQNEQEKYLVSEISKLTPKQMVGFRLRTDKLLYDTYTSEMWCAAYIMNDGCSDDGFEYFRNWVISRGRDVYYKAKENPDTLISQKDHGDEGMFEFELFWYVALKAFKNTTGKELYDYIDENNFRTKEGNYPQFEFNWQEGNLESRKKLCPNLYAEFENR